MQLLGCPPARGGGWRQPGGHRQRRRCCTSYQRTDTWEAPRVLTIWSLPVDWRDGAPAGRMWGWQAAQPRTSHCSQANALL
jgi:hypothetical protein